jgi:hypothetical protein
VRKKLAIGIGLVLVLLTVALVVVALIPTAEPPLRVGMTTQEVGDVMDSPGIRDRQRESFVTRVDGKTTKNTFVEASDWLGNRTAIEVCYDRDHRVESWHRISMARVRPRWVMVTMKCLGW